MKLPVYITADNIAVWFHDTECLGCSS